MYVLWQSIDTTVNANLKLQIKISLIKLNRL